MTNEVIGRLAARQYQPGDALPAVGSRCLVSGAHNDVKSDQHRSYAWRSVIGYTEDDQFVCLQTKGRWPTVERLTNCWFAEIPAPRATSKSPADPECQHDLLKPDTTIEVIDKWKAKCKVCIEFFDLPGRPESSISQHRGVFFGDES